MNDFIGNHIQFIASWGQLISAGLALVGLCVIYLTVRGNRYHLPKGALQWLGSLALVPVVLLAVLICARITVIRPGVLEILNRLDELEGEVAPELSYRLVATDEPEVIEDLRGKVVLLNFWATWCMPCRKEMPELDRLQKDHPSDLVVLTISDEERDTLVAYQGQFDFSMRSGFLESFPWVNMGSERPVTFLIDREGVVRRYFTGPWEYDHFERAIEPFL